MPTLSMVRLTPGKSHAALTNSIEENAVVSLGPSLRRTIVSAACRRPRVNPSAGENEFSCHRDCRPQTAIDRTLVGEESMDASSRFTVRSIGLEGEPHVNSADHEHIVLKFYLTHCIPHQPSTGCIDFTRLQRAAKCSGQSTSRGSNDIIKRRGARLRDCG